MTFRQLWVRLKSMGPDAPWRTAIQIEHERMRAEADTAAVHEAMARFGR